MNTKSGRDVKLPARKILIRGVASHPTELVEHPELVGDRIITFAEMVGQENVIAGTDCGPGATIHPKIAWAKLRDVHRTPFPTLNFERLTLELPEGPIQTARRLRARSCGVEFKKLPVRVNQTKGRTN